MARNGPRFILRVENDFWIQVGFRSVAEVQRWMVFTGSVEIDRQRTLIFFYTAMSPSDGEGFALEAGRAVKEYLTALDDPAYGAASDVTPKFVSPSDPAAQWTGALRNAAFFAYADNYLIDVKFGIIVDVEASRAIRQAEAGASQDHDRADRSLLWHQAIACGLIHVAVLPVPSAERGRSRNRAGDRKKVEMLFAHLKRILRLDRLRLRGPSGAQFEFTLAASRKT